MLLYETKNKALEVTANILEAHTDLHCAVGMAVEENPYRGHHPVAF